MPPQSTNQIELDKQIPLANISPIVGGSKKKWGIIGIVLLVIIILSIYLFISNKSLMKSSTDLCSSYFGVCVDNSDHKWATTTDARSDFDLFNKDENIVLAFVYSSTLAFKDPDPGFTTVTLLDQTKQVYKDATSTLTRVVTGVNINDKQSIIIFLASDKDITASQVKEVADKIKIKTL